jgi:asparagine synthase (glutamine-hydrolysing)
LNTFLGKVKSIIAKILLQLSTKHLDNLAFIFSRKYQNIGEKIHKYAYAIQANSELEYYDRILSSDSENIRFLKDISINKYIDDKNIQLLKNFRFTDQIALLDVLYYLPNDILTKVDRASMSASLETRAPFLNNNVFKFAASLPLFMKSRGAASKLILRQLLSKFVPSSLMQGPKKGFSIPLAEWLRGPLQEWAETLLSECSIMKSGILDPKEVQLLWQEHISGKKNRQQILWSILMFQAWYDAQ